MSKPTSVASFELQALQSLEPDNTTAFRGTIPLTIQQSGNVHAICVWYELDLIERTLNTGPSEKSSHHWRQAAFLVSPKSVCGGDVLQCSVIIDTTCGIFCDLK